MPPSLDRDKIYRGNAIWDSGIRFGVFPTKQRTKVLLHRNRRRASSLPNWSIVWTNGERSVQPPPEPSFQNSLSRLDSPHSFHRSLSAQFLPHFPLSRSYSTRNPLSSPSRLEYGESKWDQWDQWDQWHQWHYWHTEPKRIEWMDRLGGDSILRRTDTLAHRASHPSRPGDRGLPSQRGENAA